MTSGIAKAGAEYVCDYCRSRTFSSHSGCREYRCACEKCAWTSIRSLPQPPAQQLPASMTTEKQTVYNTPQNTIPKRGTSSLICPFCYSNRGFVHPLCNTHECGCVSCVNGWNEMVNTGVIEVPKPAAPATPPSPPTAPTLTDAEKVAIAVKQHDEEKAATQKLQDEWNQSQCVAAVRHQLAMLAAKPCNLPDTRNVSLSLYWRTDDETSRLVRGVIDAECPDLVTHFCRTRQGISNELMNVTIEWRRDPPKK